MCQSKRCEGCGGQAMRQVADGRWVCLGTCGVQQLPQQAAEARLDRHVDFVEQDDFNRRHADDHYMREDLARFNKAALASRPVGWSNQCRRCLYPAPLPTLRQFDGLCLGCYEETQDWLDNLPQETAAELRHGY